MPTRRIVPGSETRFTVDPIFKSALISTVAIAVSALSPALIDAIVSSESNPGGGTQTAAVLSDVTSSLLSGVVPALASALTSVVASMTVFKVVATVVSELTTEDRNPACAGPAAITIINAAIRTREINLFINSRIQGIEPDFLLNCRD